MKDILTSLEKRREANAEIALATVVETWGSAPRPVGSKLAITAESIAGSVSAGCVEGAIIESSKSCIVEFFSVWESVFSQLKPILVAGEAAAVISVLDADSIYTHNY